VNSHSLGVEGIDQETLRKKNVVLIRRNTALPARFTERFITKSEGQRSIVIQILEGESSVPGDCTAIGRTVVRDLPAGLPKGWPVDVTFEYAANGRLSVRAVVPGTEHEAALELERTRGLSNAGIARWTQPVASAAGFDDFESMVLEAVQSPDGATEAFDHGMSGEPADPVAAEPQGAAVSATATAMPEAAEDEFAADEGADTDASGEVPSTIPVSAAPDRKAPRWVIGLIGYITSALLGLALGYLVLSLLRPDVFPRPW
jgi:molecular chaperone DnaK (HSP70)